MKRFLQLFILLAISFDAPLHAQDVPSECSRSNTMWAYLLGRKLSRLSSIDPTIDSPQDIYESYPPGRSSGTATIDTEIEISCYERGIRDGF